MPRGTPNQYNSKKRGGEDRFIDVQITQADLIGGVAQTFMAPDDGYITALDAIVQGAVTTGGSLTVKTIQAGGGGGAPNTSPTLNNTVAGISTVVPNSAAKGAGYTSNSTGGDVTTTRIKYGDRIDIVPTGFATAGSLNVTLVFNTSQPNS